MEKEIAQLLEEIRTETLLPTIILKLKKKKQLSLTESKVGGYPYMPHDACVKKDSKGVDLFFLTQINCEELPKNAIYPEKGMLQFWIGRDELYGHNYDAPLSSNVAVIYYETIDATVTVEEVKAKYRFPNEYEDSPLTEGESYGLLFTAQEQSMPLSDYHFNTLFCEKYNKLYPQNMIGDMYELEDNLYEEIYDEVGCGFDSRIGGYPGFTQQDIRSATDYPDYNILLLQLDSDEELMWGDCGIANFFITKEQLEARDFSQVLYNWDCA